MKAARRISTLAALALALVVGALAGPRIASGNPPPGQVAPSDLQALQNKVATLEKQLAALQERYDGHKHNYIPGHCTLFWNLPTLKTALDAGGNVEPGFGICLSRGQAPDKIATSGPGH